MMPKRYFTESSVADSPISSWDSEDHLDIHFMDEVGHIILTDQSLRQIVLYNVRNH